MQRQYLAQKKPHDYKNKSHVFDLQENRRRKGEQTRPLKKKRERDLSLAIQMASCVSNTMAQHSGRRSSRGFSSSWPVLGFCLLLLVSGVSGELNRASKNSKFNVKEDALNKICTEKSFPRFNIINVPFGMTQGLFVPQSCRQNKLEVCMQEVDEYRKFLKNSAGMIPILNHQRDLDKKKVEKWISLTREAANKLSLRLTEEQDTIFFALLNTIVKFKSQYLGMQTLLKLKGGNCGEHTAHALIRLLKLKFGHGLNLKIQTISLKNSNDDHVFLLLEGSHSDVSIKNNPEKVAELLEKLQGTVCDPWNHGKLGDIRKDDTGICSRDAEWTSLTLRTYDFNFSDFKILPEFAQKYICKELAKMGLDVGHKNPCKMFQPKTTKPSQNQQKDNSFKPEF